MRVFRAALCVAAVVAGTCGSVYGQVKPAGVGGDESIAVGGTTTVAHLDYGKRWLGGASVFADINWNPRYGVEGEASWLWIHQQAQTHYSTYLVGPRISLGAFGRFRPYVKGLAGDGHFNFPYNYGVGNYLVIAGGGGTDYRLNSKFRIRVADFEYQYWPRFTFGAITPYSFSTGLRYTIY
ncbi:hypothetical protein [Acidipila rosea]|uniref:Outer membrane protein with beta-barrel domain n=1 Tax=Acidipila rosea TaxID=768535 RepID=A0A4R1L6E7_9BACT|nr:hypothetical protein [Acidipila rosea]TCK73742.1 hypothetical protein C7378_1356 [Acidipila rosea]